ncbi:RecX family transcriptional regulator [Novosphingobium sp.]|uniref:regulatory protein RecX n=1 Tax=Novosphingobium sp. TaxID=1874826 RepID=UPI003342915B
MTTDNDHRRDERRVHRGGRKVPKPLDAQTLNDLALGYVARFATSGGRLGDYLKRKLRERGWAGDSDTDGANASAPPDVAGVVERLVALGYIDDAGFAQARGAGLMRRGYGARRIAETLGRDGIDAPLVAQASGNDHARRTAALAFARRRRLGPFGPGSGGNRLDPAARAKQVSALMRAGHPLAFARALVEAVDEAAAQEWVDDADDS